MCECVIFLSSSSFSPSRSASLIELLAEVLDAEMSLFGKRVLTVEEWLKRYLQRGFALRYERRKEIHADETMNTRTAKPFVPTPALVMQTAVYLLRCLYQCVCVCVLFVGECPVAEYQR